MHFWLSSALQPECVVIHETSPEDLRWAAANSRARVFVLDLDSGFCALPEQISMYERIAECCSQPIIVITDDLRQSTSLEFMLRGAFECIRKPLSALDFQMVVRRAHESSLTKAGFAEMRHPADSRRDCDQLVGSSGCSGAVYDVVRRAARLNAPVLITGESGTGKELVARAIHNLGNRSQEPFIAVPCGTIPESRSEAELFGTECAPSAASPGVHAGYLQRAGKGTLFLDEIGELSLSTQVKLFRALQQKEFRRQGGASPIPLAARVVFATHRKQEKVEGSFRRDPYSQLNMLTIHVPPMRERTEDIPILARRFLSKYVAEYDKAVRDIRPNAIKALVEYAWPGNIRELEDVIQNAVIRTDNDFISASDFPAHIRQLSEEACVRRLKINLIPRSLSERDGNKTLPARKVSFVCISSSKAWRSGGSPCQTMSGA